MPKKRFTSQYSKPQSTVHPSLSSPTTAGSSSSDADKDATPSVNDLISSLRKISAPKSSSSSSAPSPTPTLPPQIRHLLALPETLPPTPRVRARRALDSNGRRTPSGPPAPRSWLESSRHCPSSLRPRGYERVYPTDLYHLPGIKESNGRRLQDYCMRQMARHWEFIKDYERNNLADLPTRQRTELLSHIAVEGPDDGVGIEGLQNIVMPFILESAAQDKVSIDFGIEHTTMGRSNGRKQIENADAPLEDWDDQSDSSFEIGERNEEFHRLDLSGALGYSISLKQLSSLLERPMGNPPLIPLLTHLSLSHPAPSTSWRGLLALSKHMPTLTHLSLAYWPVPALTANARTAVVLSPFGRHVQYGGTNYYSHSLDGDFREAADVLRRLASRLYGLEYLDLSGCLEWIRALRWTRVDYVQDDSNEDLSVRISPRIEGIDWRHQWLKLSTLKVNGNLILGASSESSEISRFVQAIKEARATERMLSWWCRKGKRRGKWVDVVSDDYKIYDGLWRDRDIETRRKRSALDVLSLNDWDPDADDWRGPAIFDEGLDVGEDTDQDFVERSL